jgi:hypothetical protein
MNLLPIIWKEFLIADINESSGSLMTVDAPAENQNG